MADQSNILEKLEGLESRYEEVSTLITDPNVIADQQRFVKLTKEYKDLSDIMNKLNKRGQGHIGKRKRHRPEEHGP